MKTLSAPFIETNFIWPLTTVNGLSAIKATLTTKQYRKLHK